MRKTKKIILISASMIFAVSLLIGGVYLYRYLVYHSNKPVLKYKPEYWEDNVELQPVSVGDAVYYYSKGEQEGIYRMYRGEKPEFLFACTPYHYVCTDGDKIIWLVYEWKPDEYEGGYRKAGTHFFIYNRKTADMEQFTIPENVAAAYYTETEQYWLVQQTIFQVEEQMCIEDAIHKGKKGETDVSDMELMLVKDADKVRIYSDYYWQEDENYYYIINNDEAPHSIVDMVSKKSGRSVLDYSWLYQESGIKKWLLGRGAYIDLQNAKLVKLDMEKEPDIGDYCDGGVYLGDKTAVDYGYCITDGKEIADSWMRKTSLTCELYDNSYSRINPETKEKQTEHLNWNQFIIYGNLEQLYLYDAEKKQIQTMQIGDDSKQIEVIAETDAIEENNTYYLIYSEYAILIYDTDYQVVDVIWL